MGPGCSQRKGGKIGALDKIIKDTMCCLWRCWKSVQDRKWSVLLLYSDIVKYDSLLPMDCNTQGFPVLHYLLGFAQTHVHWVNDAIKPAHPLPHPSPPALSLSCIRVFSNDSALCIRVKNIGASASASVLPMNIPDWFPLGLTGGSPCSLKNSQESFPTSQFKSISPSMLSFLYGPALTSIHDYWKNNSFD